MKKLVLLIFLLILALVGAYVLYEQKTAAPVHKQSNQAEKTSQVAVCDRPLAAGRYVEYTSAIIEQNKGGCAGYERTILFFYAPWCPECRGFEKAIKASPIPEGVQILKVDYDSSTELKKQYGVTIQSTFVSIDDDGNKRVLWTGYGKEKSVDAIVENTK